MEKHRAGRAGTAEAGQIGEVGGSASMGDVDRGGRMSLRVKDELLARLHR
jgi:hypothetical protein